MGRQRTASDLVPDDPVPSVLARGSLPRATRRLAALALALFALGQLLGFAHGAFEGHRLCPEHGRIEHVPAAAAVAHDHHDGPALHDGATGGEHATCEVLLAHENPAGPVVLPPFAAHLVAPERALAACAARAVDPAASVPLLLVAPKTSPPRA